MNVENQEQDGGGADLAEQKRDLFALEAMAAGEQVPGQMSDETGAGIAPPKDLKLELTGLLSIAVGVLSPVFPTLKEVYTTESIDQAATVTAALCDKHGWLQGDGLSKYGEEIAAAIVLGPMAFGTYAAINKDLDAMKAKKPQAKNQAAEAPPAGAGAEIMLPAVVAMPSQAEPVGSIVGAGTVGL